MTTKNPVRLPRAGGIFLILAGGIALGLCGCGEPQFARDAESRSAVDALWTAVTARRLPLLEAAATRLNELRDSGQLSEETASRLQPIIGQAREGKWETAAQSLHRLIRGQRK